MFSSKSNRIDPESLSWRPLSEQLEEATGPSQSKRRESGLRSALESYEKLKKQTEADRMKAFEEAYAAGYAAGFPHGVQQALEREGQRLADFDHQLRDLIGRIESAVSLWYQKAELSLADLGLEIAKRIVNEELTVRPTAILTIVRDALGHVEHSASVKIRLNPFDLHTLEEHRDELHTLAGGISNLELVGDEQLSRGSVIVESQFGTVDATVETKLDQLRNEAA
ncbi:MAG: hypothetical protein AKCLJLPJ_00499 [Fimbriimonadales bacterium]|nr:hypothetical protein [Armatimonadota bacterium]MBV6502453.1 hypothetical protein [Fimbriimonadales bacterium]NOG91656.1 hypothetical protein [Armatimonadota bacterium]